MNLTNAAFQQSMFQTFSRLQTSLKSWISWGQHVLQTWVYCIWFCFFLGFNLGGSLLLTIHSRRQQPPWRWPISKWSHQKQQHRLRLRLGQMAGSHLDSPGDFFTALLGETAVAAVAGSRSVMGQNHTGRTPGAALISEFRCHVQNSLVASSILFRGIFLSWNVWNEECVYLDSSWSVCRSSGEADARCDTTHQKVIVKQQSFGHFLFLFKLHQKDAMAEHWQEIV